MFVALCESFVALGYLPHLKNMVGGNEMRRREGNDKEAEATNDESKKGVPQEQPRCLSIATKGIQTAGEFASMMSALMSDVIEGNVTPQVSNAAVNAGGKLLKVVEMQLKYGTTIDGSPRRLDLVSEAE